MPKPPDLVIRPYIGRRRRHCSESEQLAGVCRWKSTMQTDIARYAWKRHDCFHCTRIPVRKRERRPLGFIGPGAARLRRFLKRSYHRRARRTVRAALRISNAAHRLTERR